MTLPAALILRRTVFADLDLDYSIAPPRTALPPKPPTPEPLRIAWFHAFPGRK
jgi:hypothetical protein